MSVCNSRTPASNEHLRFCYYSTLSTKTERLYCQYVTNYM